ncbi:MAG: polysaccharide deacetylase family protein [Cyanobacteria bacterium]|nr:polysaccharide deacetylase family protein [Cyanobacteriota bacterium]
MSGCKTEVISKKEVKESSTDTKNNFINSKDNIKTNSKNQLQNQQNNFSKGDFSPIYGIVVNNGSRDKMSISLTFDADLTPSMKEKLLNGSIKSYYNSNVIKILLENNTPATLFITGLWAEYYDNILKDIAENNLFEIGNHSYKHYVFSNPTYGLPILKESEKENDFIMSQFVFKSLLGYEPKLFRFPAGSYSDEDIKLANKYGLTVIGWDVVSGDAFNNNSESIIRNVIENVKPGSIIVMHLNDGNTAPKTAEALEKIIPLLQKKGYKFLKVSNLLKEMQS